jgi:hypothetical protein
MKDMFLEQMDRDSLEAEGCCLDCGIRSRLKVASSLLSATAFTRIRR